MANATGPLSSSFSPAQYQAVPLGEPPPQEQAPQPATPATSMPRTARLVRDTCTLDPRGLATDCIASVLAELHVDASLSGYADARGVLRDRGASAEAQARAAVTVVDAVLAALEPLLDKLVLHKDKFGRCVGLACRGKLIDLQEKLFERRHDLRNAHKVLGQMGALPPIEAAREAMKLVSYWTTTSSGNMAEIKPFLKLLSELEKLGTLTSTDRQACAAAAQWMIDTSLNISKKCCELDAAATGGGLSNAPGLAQIRALRDVPPKLTQEQGDAFLSAAAQHWNEASMALDDRALIATLNREHGIPPETTQAVLNVNGMRETIAADHMFPADSREVDFTGVPSLEHLPALLMSLHGPSDIEQMRFPCPGDSKPFHADLTELPGIQTREPGKAMELIFVCHAGSRGTIVMPYAPDREYVLRSSTGGEMHEVKVHPLGADGKVDERLIHNLGSRRPDQGPPAARCCIVA